MDGRQRVLSCCLAPVWVSCYYCAFRIAAHPSEQETTVARVCAICGKGPQFGHNISHSHRVTKRRFNPNLQKMRIQHAGKVRRAYVCTRCLRSGRVQKVF
jgi:large subunit ribosomal protein L28